MDPGAAICIYIIDVHQVMLSTKFQASEYNDLKKKIFEYVYLYFYG